MASQSQNFVRVASMAEIEKSGYRTVQVNGHTIALIHHDQQVFAVDNRCPHMGFPLDKGSVRDGILTCHWHHARFDLASGGTFDQWADDVRSFPVRVEEQEVWVDVAPLSGMTAYHRQRLLDGLERDIPLVLAKAVIALVEEGDSGGSYSSGLEFGAHFRQNGWGQGLTMHTCMMNLLPHLEPIDRPRALYHGLSAVARDSAGSGPRFTVQALPAQSTDLATLKRWFRRFIEVRDDEGAERCIVSAVRAGADHRQMADMLFAAATDHRYIDIGHPVDFTNKALEALDHAGWQHAELVLTSLVRGYAAAGRMEESNSWRYPIDLIALLDTAFEALPAALEQSASRRGEWTGHAALTPILLDDDPQASVAALLEALHSGASEAELAGSVAYAAALRIAHFHTSNEFGDWDTALHTFTFANAVHQGLRRTPSSQLVRGIFDAAMSIYLDRFLNVPAAPLPQPDKEPTSQPETYLSELAELLNYQQQVNQAGRLVASYLNAGGAQGPLLATMGRLLLREDRDFHTIQCVETAFRQVQLLGTRPESVHVLVAAARYLAAHAPTMRAQGQTYNIAWRLHRGERVYEG